MVGDGSRFAAGVTTMPGIKVGEGSIIEFDGRLSRDIPDGTRLRHPQIT